MNQAKRSLLELTESSLHYQQSLIFLCNVHWTDFKTKGWTLSSLHHLNIKILTNWFGNWLETKLSESIELRLGENEAGVDLV